MTSETESPTKSSEPSLADVTARTISVLQRGLLDPANPRAHAHSKAMLASLRQGAGTRPERNPLAWQRALDASGSGLPARLTGKGDAPSASESAYFDALTLYAVHQQSQRKPMHVSQVSFPRAVGRLIALSTSESVKPRFDALLLARNTNTRRHQLRSLVQLLRAKELGFDYGRFATDLRSLESGDRNRVLLRWGRDLAAGRTPAPSTTSTPSDSPTL